MDQFQLTETELLQNELLSSIEELYEKTDLSEIELAREAHVKYIQKGFEHGFPSAYVSLDASRPWLVYWALHSVDLLGFESPVFEFNRVEETLKRFQVPHTGGFCGGDSRVLTAHLAATFASVSALAILADPRGYELIDRAALKGFLQSLKTPQGAFRMHLPDGEIDVRAAYCAVVVGKLTGCWDKKLEVGLVNWIRSCQTWEGGFGGVPGAEAHGGYTYCALAALSLLLGDDNAFDSVVNDREALQYWLTAQQVQPIGGFRGRTNKLVDGCYSFWQTACFELIEHGEFVDSLALQRFILVACQDNNNNNGGGLRDKPGKGCDFYHTCYCLSGLSLAQHQIRDPEFILGGPTNLLRAVDVKFNLVKGKAEAMIEYYSSKR